MSTTSLNHVPPSSKSTRWWRRAQSSFRFVQAVARQEQSLRRDVSGNNHYMLRWHTEGFSRKKALIQALRDPSLISPGIYLGSSFNASNADTLRRLNIKAIVNVAAEVDNYFPSEIKYCHIPLRDEYGQHFEKEQCERAIAFVREQLDDTYYPDQRCVLIHCVFGLSRSVTMATHIKMALENRTEYELWDTISTIQAVRPLLSINVDLLPEPHAHFLRTQQKARLDTSRKTTSINDVPSPQPITVLNV